jgi:hypothetical protein
VLSADGGLRCGTHPWVGPLAAFGTGVESSPNARSTPPL